MVPPTPLSPDSRLQRRLSKHRASAEVRHRVTAALPVSLYATDQSVCKRPGTFSKRRVLLVTSVKL
jgi:hypothetical protein